jgi:hypothetical protein
VIPSFIIQGGGFSFEGESQSKGRSIFGADFKGELSNVYLNVMLLMVCRRQKLHYRAHKGRYFVDGEHGKG